MQKYLYVFVISAAVVGIAIIGVNCLVDPFRILHRPWVRADYYVPDLRIQASGIINSGDFGSYILGTSVAENFLPSEASQIFAEKFANISLPGATFAERSVVLRYALARGGVSSVIYSLDWDTLKKKDSISDSPIAPYTYLYDDVSWNDIRLYASCDFKLMRFALCRNVLVHGSRLCSDTRDLEHLTEWYSDQAGRSQRFGGLHRWMEAEGKWRNLPALHKITQSIRGIEMAQLSQVAWDENERAAYRATQQQLVRDRLFRYVGKYPDVAFYVFFPPYSRLKFALMRKADPQDFEKYLETITTVVREAEKYENCKIFGFENEVFLDDIANYADTVHYHPRYNSMMIHWMKDGDHRLTTANVEEYLEDITARAEQYPLREIGVQLDAYLRSQENMVIQVRD